eukprot:767302-Hanusia_phi.AAC.2
MSGMDGRQESRSCHQVSLRPETDLDHQTRWENDEDMPTPSPPPPPRFFPSAPSLLVSPFLPSPSSHCSQSYTPISSSRPTTSDSNLSKATTRTRKHPGPLNCTT